MSSTDLQLLKQVDMRLRQLAYYLQHDDEEIPPAHWNSQPPPQHAGKVRSTKSTPKGKKENYRLILQVLYSTLFSNL